MTDFGISDPYIGQMKAVLHEALPSVPIIDLLHNIPSYNVKAAAYLLPALSQSFLAESVFLCVVDPGVGSERLGCVARVDDRWYVGPENGLFDILMNHGHEVEYWHLQKAAAHIPSTFHGRDIFAPVAALLADGRKPGDWQQRDLNQLSSVYQQPDLAEVIYIDHYGNLITGLRFDSLPEGVHLRIGSKSISFAVTFSDVPKSSSLAYKNSNGLLEIAINEGNAAEYFKVSVGHPILLVV